MSSDWSVRNVIMFIINIITSTSAVFICIFAMYHIFIKSKEELNQQKVRRDLIIITLICIILHALLAVIDPFMFYYELVSYDYNASFLIYRFWWGFWLLAKTSLYFVYSYRVYHSFKDSAFPPSKLSYTLIVIGCLCQFVNGLITIIVGDTWNAAPTDFTLICEINALILDALLIFFVSLLFVKPLIELINLQHVGGSENNQKSMILFETITRISLLALITLSSSFIYQLIWVISTADNFQNNDLYSIGFIWGIDTVTNMICLFLSYNFAAKIYYKKLCIFHGYCKKVIIYFANKPSTTNSTNMQMSTQIEINSTNNTPNKPHSTSE